MPKRIPIVRKSVAATARLRLQDRNVESSRKRRSQTVCDHIKQRFYPKRINHGIITNIQYNLRVFHAKGRFGITYWSQIRRLRTSNR